MLELLCFQHYQERISNGTNQETKETTNGFTKSYSQETKEKERKIKCLMEKGLMAQKQDDHQKK
tara:strand:+ start:1659 stop:1850 length:192 start_codon:yes stop_codon:yes gene_type:complete